MKIIEPSLLSINKEKALEQINQIRDFGLKLVHYDVMDGKFVPPTALKTEYLKDLELAGIKPNIHLMVSKPDEWIELYKNYKVNSITFHAESQSVEECKRLLAKIKSLGFLAGFAVKPHTDLNQYKELFALTDIILIMSVEPGWGGQGFIPDSLKNLEIANQAKQQHNNIIIEIDGGINFNYIKKLYNQIDWFVTGSWFFKNIDRMGQYLSEFKNLK
ncbi:MAG: ribulose-phosphate 3-epimerase [Mycoplasma sp.]|nr:ribulose-phosphate 3-epimerase [Candidatus Hennigella equi]